MKKLLVLREMHLNAAAVHNGGELCVVVLTNKQHCPRFLGLLYFRPERQLAPVTCHSRSNLLSFKKRS
jgi:hypothetical protein